MADAKVSVQPEDILAYKTAADQAALEALWAAHPFKHRKHYLYHLHPQQLTLVLVKNVAVVAVKLLAAETPPQLPLDRPRELAVLAWEHLKWPIAKDLAISSVARVYELEFVRWHRSALAVRGA